MYFSVVEAFLKIFHINRFIRLFHIDKRNVFILLEHFNVDYFDF